MMDWLIENWAGLLTALTAIIAAASAVANLTKTESDNKAVAAVSKVVNVLALNLKKK